MNPKYTMVVSNKKDYYHPDYITFIEVLDSVFNVRIIGNNEFNDIIEYYSGFGDPFNYLNYAKNLYVFECEPKYHKQIRKLCSIFKMKIEEEFYR